MNNLPPPRRDAQRPLRGVLPLAPDSLLNRAQPALSLGERVRERRRRAGLTMAELGRLAGLAATSVLDAESGRGSSTTAHRLLALMGSTPAGHGVANAAALNAQPRFASTRLAPVANEGAAPRAARTRAAVQMTPERLELLMEDPMAYAIAIVAISKARRSRR